MALKWVPHAHVPVRGKEGEFDRASLVLSQARNSAASDEELRRAAASVAAVSVTRLEAVGCPRGSITEGTEADPKARAPTQAQPGVDTRGGHTETGSTTEGRFMSEWKTGVLPDMRCIGMHLALPEDAREHAAERYRAYAELARDPPDGGIGDGDDASANAFALAVQGIRDSDALSRWTRYEMARDHGAAEALALSDRLRSDVANWHPTRPVDLRHRREILSAAGWLQFWGEKGFGFVARY